MCRFSVKREPAPSSPGLEAILNEDDFSWFDAIDDLPDEQLLEYGAGVSQNYQAELPAARDSDSSADIPLQDAAMSDSNHKPSASAGCSDTSSYDIVQLFKQQVEQDPAVVLASVQAQYGFAPYAQAAEQCMALAACSMPDMKLPAFSAAPMQLAPAMAPAVVPAPSGPSSTFSPLPSTLNMGPGMPLMQPSAGSIVRKLGKPGSRHQKSQAEVDAAVERIKQKRRESAQRSRARKNEYMRQLEIENQGLKEEVHRLQSMLASMQRGTGCMQQQQMSPAIGV